MIRLKFVAAALLVLSSALAFGQSELKYEISFPNALHHEAEVSLQIPEIPAGPLTVRMSRSSTGRYATHEFGKNVYNVKAFNKAGKPISITQVKGDVYQVDGHDGSARITYTVFGNWVDGTYLAIDKTHAHMNMPATFMWVKGMDDRKISIKFNDLEKYGWKVATQLVEGKDGTYSADNLQYFMDSPTELSAFKVGSWEDVNPDKTRQTIKVAIHSDDPQSVVDNYTKMIRRMVDEMKAIFVELPTFDYGVYTFLQDVNPENSGDGMEHRNSTVIVERTEKVEGYEEDLLSTFSHEFFHAWNVERIRPESLEPFNFEEANMSSDLWFAEGFTQYYGTLVLKRAGFRDQDSYLKTLASLANSVLNQPGANTYSPLQISRYAVFADAGVAVDQTNQANIFTSYYYYGAAIALALDLRLRSDYKLTLDDYMQAVWKAHGKTEIPYTSSNLENILAKLTSKTFAQDFFSRYVYGIEKNDYVKLLANAGLVLRRVSPEKASLGMLRLMPVRGKMKVVSNTLKGSAAYQAGMDNGDYFLKINDNELKNAADLNTFLSKYKAGQEVTLTFEHRKEISTVKVKLQEDTAFEVVPVETTGQKLTPAMAKFRASWLDTQLK